MTMNTDELHKLLSIAELANKWPHLKEIRVATERLLREHEKDLAKDNLEAKKAEDAKAAKAKADEEARLKSITEESARKAAPSTSDETRPHLFTTDSASTNNESSAPIMRRQVVDENGVK